MINLEAIKARCEAADEGPWTARPFHEVWSASNLLLVEDCYTDANAAFIAHARTDVPALVAEVERLRAEVARQRQVVGRNPTPEEYNRAAARANCDRAPCSCGMHRDRT